MPEKPKQAPPVGVRLTQDLRQYLEGKAKEAFRSLSSEIALRLEKSRQADQQHRGEKQ